MELVYASKLLAKTIDEVDEKLASNLEKLEDLTAALSSLKESVSTNAASLKDLVSLVDRKLEVLPLVLAGKLEDLIEKRTNEKFEDLRVTLDEMRNKLWAIKKQIKDSTGAHQLPSKEQIAQWEGEKEQKDGVTIRKGAFLAVLPFSDGTLRVIKIVGIILGALLAGTATTGGIWALVDRIKHALSGGG